MSWAKCLLGVLLACVAAACSNGGGYYYSTPVTGPSARVQVMHASPDAPPIIVQVDDATAVTWLDYAQGSAELPLPAGTHTITVQALTPNSPTTLIGPTSIDLSANMDYVIAAEGPVASISAEIFPHELAVVPSGSTRIQFLHATPRGSDIDVYVTTPGADLSSENPVGRFAFHGSIGPLEIPAGQYEIRLTAAGTQAPVLLDSGTISFNGGSELAIALLDNTGPGSAAIMLTQVDAFGNTTPILDENTPATVRVIHDSPNAPPLSVIANSDLANPLCHGQLSGLYPLSKPRARHVYAGVHAGE